MEHIQSFERYSVQQISEPAKKQEIVDYLKSKLGFTNFSYLSSGMNGIAFLIDSNKVLKVTTDRSEAVECSKIKGKKMKHLADIYNVFALKGEYEGLFVIVLEYLRISPAIKDGYKSIKKIFSKHFNYRYGRLSEFLDEYSHKMVKPEELQIVCSKIAESGLDDFFNQLLQIVNELKAYSISSIDYTNFNNLGYKPDGSLAYFDMGFGDENGELVYLERIKI